MYIKGDCAECKKLLQEAKNIFEQDEKIYKNMYILENPDRMYAIFYDYLNLLTDWRENNPQYYSGDYDEEIYIIGDSHSLSPAHIICEMGGKKYKIITKFFFGMKAFHLTAKGSKSRREAFKKIISSLPKNAKIILSLGEIDCRLNEGIFPNYLKDKSKDLQKQTQRLVKSYIEFAVGLCDAKGLNISVCNIPAPQEEFNIAMGYKPDEHGEFLEMFKFFNNALEQELEDKNTKIIDLYSLTKNDDGWANNKQHIDGAHLFPNIISEFLI